MLINPKFKKMKKLISSLFGLLVVLSLTAQTTRDSNKLTRAERKEIKAEERAANKAKILQAVKDQRFVIEAYTLEDRYGRFVQVSPVTNFILVDSSAAVIQFALPHRVGGPNGLGGVTEEGRVRDLEFSKKKPKYGVSFKMEVAGPLFGASQVFVNVNEDGLATMRFSGVFGSRFTMRGNFELLEDSRIFQGVASF